MNEINNNEISIFNLPPSTLEGMKDGKKKRGEKKKKVEKDINNLAVKFIEDPTERNFELLMRRMKCGLKSFAFKMLNNNEAVEDVLSRTMECAYFKRDTFDVNKGNFSTWMYKITLNNCIKYLKDDFGYHMPNTVTCDFAEAFDSSVDDDEIDKQKKMETGVVDETIGIVYNKGEYKRYTREEVMNDIYDASVRCMDNLPDSLRVVMKERYLEHKKVEQISTDNNIPLSSVKNWLRKGAVVLNDELKRTCPDIYDMYVEIKQYK